jgi:HIRAN domain
MGLTALIFVVLIIIGYLLAATKRKQPITVAPHIHAALAPQAATAQPIAHSGRSYPFSEVTNDSNYPHARSIHTKIRGVTKDNPDGVDRQRIIEQWCRFGDALFLVREPSNPFDPNAIQVKRIVYSSDNPEDKPRLGEQIGYVSRELAEKLAPRVDRDGSVLMAWIMEITGGGDSESLGVNIQIEEYRPAKHRATTRSKTTKKVR